TVGDFGQWGTGGAGSGSRNYQFFTGDFDGDGLTDVAFYYSGDGNLWVGRSDGDQIAWHNAGNAAMYDNLLDGAHHMDAGDFDGDGDSDLLFYSAADSNWWMGLSDGNQIAWHNAGNTSGFGSLLTTDRHLFTGDFNGDGRLDEAFLYVGDGNLW